MNKPGYYYAIDSEVCKLFSYFSLSAILPNCNLKPEANAAGLRSKVLVPFFELNRDVPPDE